MRFFTFFLPLAVTLLNAIPCGAAVQRMGIAPGDFNLAANAAQGIAAYCFDLTKDSPSLATHFTSVLTDTANATVTFGSQTMSLQNAIQVGKVTIRGTQPTVEQMMEEASNSKNLAMYPLADRQRLLQMAQAWHQMTPARTRGRRARTRPSPCPTW